MSAVGVGTKRLAGMIEGWSPIGRAYAAGLALMVVNVVVVALGASNGIEQGILVLAMGLLTLGLVQEAYAKVTRWVRPVWVRWAIVPLGAMVVAVSLAGGSYVVSEATGQDPGYFPRAVSFMAPLAFVPILALFGVVALVSALLVMLLKYLLELAFPNYRDGPAEHGWIRLGRLTGTLVAVGLLASIIDDSSALGKATRDIAAWAAKLDMHKDPVCGAGEQDRIKRITDALVIRVHKVNGATTFTRELCPLAPQQ